MNVSFILTVLVTFCLPALIMTGLSTTSLAAGVLGCAVIWSLRAAAVTPAGTHLTVGWKFVSWVFIGMVGVTLHALLSWAVTASRPDATRMVASVAVGVVVIGEFGVIGIVILLVYCRLLYRSYWYVRNESAPRRSNREHVRELFLHACVIMYTTELFVRGVGYFSPSGFLLIVALISFSRLKRRSPVAARPRASTLAYPFPAV